MSRPARLTADRRPSHGRATRDAAGTMRDRFYGSPRACSTSEPRGALVLAVIGAGYLDPRGARPGWPTGSSTSASASSCWSASPAAWR